MILKPFLIFAGVIILLAQADSCFQKRDSEMTKIEIVEGDKGLLIYFRKDIDPNAPYEFGNTVLSEPHPGGQGFNPLPGIVEQYGLIPIKGHQGVAVKFRENATPEQIGYVKTRVNASPIVYKVFENVPPSKINAKDFED